MVTLAALTVEVAALRQRVAVLEAGRGPRDEGDVEFMRVLGPVVLDETFTASSLLRHAQVNPALRRELASRTITSTSELGHLLRRLSGIPMGGFVIQRGARGRGGRSWTVTMVSSFGTDGRRGTLRS